ncbi:hypothetical protein M2139_000589 [Enterococcus sp. PF1-24]|uniref:hypothetical protein n=1 Tax=unclassified Enterococcus TaxID=2608891 RepID=UPI0024763460|nr:MULTISPECIES: hypothetical protein [unclassified Enterococcus]MDH6363752.1 hypothetical protein [Enterococcus sp. PFB1-1]MDH6400708.1 hypothetical protein [Enterococcus sp. PF1-24]
MERKSLMENKRKKKQNKLGLLLVLVALLLLGVNVLSNTRAKYITKSDEVTETARVAKWFEGATMELDLFKDAYATDDTASYSGENSVKSADGDKVVAPGTTHSYEFSPALTGSAPEVAYRMEFEVTGEYTGDWNNYYPLLFTLVTTSGGVDTTVVTDVSLDDLIAAMNDSANALVYGPGEVASSENTKYTISWNWPFSTDEATDEKDTALGLAAIDADLEINLTAAMKAVQID